MVRSSGISLFVLSSHEFISLSVKSRDETIIRFSFMYSLNGFWFGKQHMRVSTNEQLWTSTETHSTSIQWRHPLDWKRQVLWWKCFSPPWNALCCRYTLQASVMWGLFLIFTSIAVKSKSNNCDYCQNENTMIRKVYKCSFIKVYKRPKSRQLMCAVLLGKH